MASGYVDQDIILRLTQEGFERDDATRYVARLPPQAMQAEGRWHDRMGRVVSGAESDPAFDHAGLVRHYREVHGIPEAGAEAVVARIEAMHRRGRGQAPSGGTGTSSEGQAVAMAIFAALAVGVGAGAWYLASRGRR